MPASPIAPDPKPVWWAQLNLFDPEVVELHLRIGIVPDADHMQWQLEVRDPAANTLLGMLSSPHVSASQWIRHLAQIESQLREQLSHRIDPF